MDDGPWLRHYCCSDLCAFLEGTKTDDLSLKPLEGLSQCLTLTLNLLPTYPQVKELE